MNDCLDPRYAAAQKTIRVLKKRVFDLQNGVGDAFQRQLERVRAREAEGRRKRAVSEARAEALARHSERLEEQVAERTRELKVIHDNVAAGFLLVDRDLRIQPGHTASCVELLGGPVVGRTLFDVLRLSSRDASFYQLSLEQIFEDLLPEEVAVGQLERRFELPGRTLELDVRVVRDEAGAVHRLLYTLTDISALVEAERQAAENRMLVSILGDRASFAAFLADARGQLACAREAVSDQVFVRRVVHTLKGNAAAWGLRPVVSVAHAEEELEALGLDALDRIEVALTATLDPHARLLGSLLEQGEKSVRVSVARLDDLQDLLEAPSVPVVEVRRWVLEVQLVRADLLIGPLATFTEKLGERLGKRVRLEVHGGEVEVLPEAMVPVLQQLPHLVRNAVDHGIESEEERGAKEPVGTLRLTIGATETDWSLTLSDDGRGIDGDRLVRAAVRRGVLDEAEAARLDESGKLELLYAHGVSSREEVTDTSGRGVGMGAVRVAIRQAGGRIRLESRPGLGTTFTLQIPKPPRLLRPEPGENREPSVVG